jgi:hypothetical protein
MQQREVASTWQNLARVGGSAARPLHHQARRWGACVAIQQGVLLLPLSSSSSGSSSPRFFLLHLMHVTIESHDGSGGHDSGARELVFGDLRQAN